MFCQLELLRHCFPPSVRRILHELPESLDETYKRILKEIKKANRGYAHRLLQCLVAAIRPLRVEELAEILAFEFNGVGTPKLNPDWRWADQQEAVLSACSSLVTIVNDGESLVVQFSHFSVKEFLTSSRTAESSGDISYYHVLLEPAHTILAQACLGVLLGLDECIDEEILSSFPLARYAAEHWVHHAQFENVSSCIKDGMECLFDADKPHFAAWLRIYNVEGSQVTPLYQAALFGFRELVEYLLIKHPEDLNTKGGSLGTPLHAAVQGRDVGVLLSLLEHGASTTIRGIWDETPLHQASCFGSLEIGRWLLHHGADVNARDDTGWTPLYEAALNGKLEFARLLLEHKAEVDAKNTAGKTPLQAASKTGYLEVAQLLLEYGAKEHRHGGPRE